MHVKSREFEGVKTILTNDEKVIWKNVNKTSHAISIQDKSIIFCIERDEIFDWHVSHYVHVINITLLTLTFQSVFGDW